MSNLNGQDDPLFDLIAAKQWKQAFHLCQKKMKKAKDDDVLQVRMIVLLLSWPDPTRQALGLNELDTLIDRKAPLTNIDALLELDRGLQDMKEHEARILQAWQRATTTRPHDELLHKVWYQSKYDAGNFKAAQQATIAWKKNFPNQRVPYFLYILVTHLISQQSKDEMEKKVSAGLVFKNLQATVDASYAMGIAKSTKSTRAISTMQDLLLFLRIYRAQGRYTEASNVLQRIRELNFQGFQNEWEIVRQMIELFELAQSWTYLYALCQSILEDAMTAVLDPSNYKGPWGKIADDWKVWDGFITASGKCESADTSLKTQELIASFKAEKINSRNAHLASMKLYHSETAAGPVDSQGLLQAVVEYLKRHLTKYSAFQDIRPHLPYLRPEHQLELIQITNQLSKEYSNVKSESEVHKVVVEVNVLKLEYHLLVSPDHPRRAKLLPTFISNCLLLYSHSLKLDDNSPPVERRTSDDAALMAAMGLIHLFKKDDESGNSSDGKNWPRTLLRSIVILEYLLLNSPHNYDALLILVRLYMHMGAGSLAMERYSRLSVKNLQFTYMSWVLFSNISSVHPYPVQISSADGNSQATFDPLKEIKSMLDWHQGAEMKLKQNTLKMQENGQWDMSMDALSTTDALSRCFAKHQLFVEAKRIKRLTSSSHDVSNYPAFQIPLRTTDMGERVPFSSFEAPSQPHFEEILPMTGPRNPNDTWLEQQLSVARFWDSFHSNGKSQIDAKHLSFMKQASARLGKTLTKSESGAGNVIHSLEQLHSAYYLKSSEYLHDNVAKGIREMLKFLEITIATAYNNLASFVEQSEDEPPLDIHPTEGVFHRQYMCLEIAQFTVPVLKYIVAENAKLAYVHQEWLIHTVQRIKDRCKDITVDIHRAAKDLKARLSCPNAIRDLEEKVLTRTKTKEAEDVVAYDIQRKFEDRLNVTKVLNDLHASWIDGLDGVIRTKGA